MLKTSAEIILATTWTYPHIGGVSTHMTLLARGLGIDPKYIINFDMITGQVSNILGRARRKIISKMRGEAVTAHAEGMVRLLKNIDCDILHCHDAMATWAAGVAREKFRKRYRIVSTVHGPVSRHMLEHGSASSSPDVTAVRACEEAAWRYADQIIAVDTTQRQICTEQKADPKKISVIPNAVDLNEIDTKLQLLHMARDPEIDWLLVPRRLAPKNGVTYAIEAMQMLPARCKLFIAGDGIEEGRCRQLIEKNGLHDRVALLGAVPRDVVLMLSTVAKATLIPSVPSHGIVEATSIAGIEAMACRVPLVASSIGGLVELVKNEETGLLVPPAQPELLATAVRTILSGDASVDRMVCRAREQVEQRFSMPPWLAAIHHVYENVLDMTPSATA